MRSLLPWRCSGELHAFLELRQAHSGSDAAQFASAFVTTRSVVGQHSRAACLPMRLPSWQPSSLCKVGIPKCQRLHSSLKRNGAKLLRDWARANLFFHEALRQAPAFPDDLIQPAAGGICGDCKSRILWRLSIPNLFKPLEDQVSTGGQSQLMSLCTLPSIRCSAITKA
ncbi:unnamed protein product [Polarella glacialis]|uniref:Uncharacterized protein n=1 Tax=Polarella glacialis TaxID=89957 RepID=A0A813LEB5_POLGL|nr:unnamed protein product [Polarella glacialis]